MSADDKPRRLAETPFIMVPLVIARDRTLSWAAKALFGAIYSLSHLPNGCHCTNASLGARVGLSTRHVKRMMKELEDRALIERTPQPREASIINVLWRVQPLKIQDKMSTDRPKGDKMSPKFGGHPVTDRMSPKPSRARASASGDEDFKKRGEKPGSNNPGFSPSEKNGQPPPVLTDTASGRGGEEPEPPTPQLTSQEYAAKLLDTLRRQPQVNGKRSGYRWDATSKVWRYNGPDWLLPMLQSVQAEVLAILNAEREAKP